LSNLKQIDLSMIMYSSDNDGRFPTQQAAGITWATGATWTTSSFDGNWNCPDPNWISGIIPYMKNEQILNCPTAPFIQDVGTPAGANGSSYDYNAWVAGEDQYTTFTGSDGAYIGLGRQQSLMVNPVAIVMVWDATVPGGVQGYKARLYPAYGGAAYDGANCGFYGAGATCLACVPNVHNGGFNSGFCDGHAKWLNDMDFANRIWGDGLVCP
jgi:prepilin-type processing-associated H-X9-DG protein